MSDSIKIAEQAERDLNSHAAKQGSSTSDSANESGVNSAVENKFPGSTVSYGSEASGAGNNRDMPEGGINPKTGQAYKAGDFEGVGGPEDKAKAALENEGGSDDIRSNIR